MAQVVQPKFRQTSSLRHTLKCLSNQIGVQGRPDGMAKYAIAIPWCLTSTTSAGPSGGFCKSRPGFEVHPASRRTQVITPALPEDDPLPLPPGLTLVRTPRYAQRKAYRTW